MKIRLRAAMVKRCMHFTFGRYGEAGKSAWHLEEVKLRKNNKRFWSLHNEMLRFQLIQATFIAAIGLIFGWKSMLLFIAGAVIGFLLLETVNYIEHYGLRRKKIGDKYERTLPIHSWNSQPSDRPDGFAGIIQAQ